MAETLCSIDNVKKKAGTNFPTTTSDAEITVLINNAESYINDRTQVDWVALFSGLATDKKNILRDFASSHAAMFVIIDDPNSYNSLAEAQFIADVNFQRYTETEREIKEKVAQDFMRGT